MTSTTTTKPTTAGGSSTNSSNVLLLFVVICIALWIRVLVGYQPHSGQNNFHGSKVAYGGDYEAQRHWMELTFHLPIGDWYWYDLQYWGLDYPPLTAYVSYICGALSHKLVGPQTVELVTSRGYENDPIHKAFMRSTVWFLDLIIYFPSSFLILKLLWETSSSTSSGTTTTTTNFNNNNKKKNHDSCYDLPISFLLSLIQPAILLIDHGHFQYNTVALGFSLAGLYYMTDPKFYPNCLVGSIYFCLALNFKQMTLYYSPVIFAYLLGRCFRFRSSHQNQNHQQEQHSYNIIVLQRFLSLGITVIVCFIGMVWPFLVFGPSSTTSTSTVVINESENDTTTTTTLGIILYRGKHVLHRIFPFQRGLFEGKVANLWCALDTKPVNIRDRIPTHIQPLVALAVTFTLMLPSCIILFLVGRRIRNQQQQHQSSPPPPSSSSKNTTDDDDDDDDDNNATTQEQQREQHASDLISLLWVHEKSILLALAPASLLGWEDEMFCFWFAIVAAWTMWPLLVVDQLQVAYVCTILIFAIATNQLKQLRAQPPPRQQQQQNSKDASSSSSSSSDWTLMSAGWRILCQVSFVAMMGLHVLEMIVTVPSHLPDLFPVLWSVGGCALCCLAWARTTGCLLVAGMLRNNNEGSNKEKDD